MGRDFFEIAAGWVINKKHVIAVERVLQKEKPEDPVEKAIEKTRLTFITGKQLIVDGHFDSVKKDFL